MRNVPRKAFASFFTFLLVTSLALASDPPWKGKPYQQWDDKDIQRVFADSPWARKTTITGLGARLRKRISRILSSPVPVMPVKGCLTARDPQATVKEP